MTDNFDDERDCPSVIVNPCHPSAELARRLELREKIGEGGIAQIQRVRDLNLLREMVSKKLLSELRDDESTIGRLIEEAQITAQLDHPGIVPVHELAVDGNGDVFFTMKLVRGRNLHEILSRADYSKRTNEEFFEHLQIFLKVCDAVSFAHSRGVIHRDLKPDNVMVGEYGEVYVMDWGIAKLTENRPSSRDLAIPDASEERYEIEDEDGLVIGTPGFMAPEQCRGDMSAVDKRTDVFSLGAILYHILTQAPPYFGRSSQEMVINTLTRDVIPPEERVDLNLHPELCRIAMKALSRESSQRYASVAEVKRDVERFLLSGWNLERRNFKPGQIVLREGDPGEEAFIIVQGRCAAFKTIDGVEMELREMTEGEIFGETAMLTAGPRTASVRAIEPTSLLTISLEQFRQEIGVSWVVGCCLKALSERFRERDADATSAAIESERFKLATSILKFMNFTGQNVGKDRREARWSTLCEVLSSHLHKTPAETLGLVESLGFVTIDEARDTIALLRAG